MPEYLHPGVYIEEIERGPKPIEGVPTSTAGIIGETERGPTTPRLVTSFQDYQRWFGSVFDRDKYLPYSVNGFFENGGKRAYIARIVGNAATFAFAEFGDFRIQASGPGVWGNNVVVQISPSTTLDKDDQPIGFRIRLAVWSHGTTPPDGFQFGLPTTSPPALTEDFDDLVTDEASPDFYGKRFPLIDLGIDGHTNQGPDSSAIGMLVRNAGIDPAALPELGDPKPLQNGEDDPAAIGVDDFKGDAIPGGRSVQGLSALELDSYRDIALVYSPGVSTDVASAIVEHCEDERFRFAIFDSPKSTEPTNNKPRNSITDSTRAGFYCPWIVASDPKTGARKLIPPGGHVLGVYARSDTERGVFKSPANEILRGALSLEFEINDSTQDVLNPRGVNAIRSFPGRGIRVWGARTMSSNALWKYVSVRRLFLFLERSIYEGTQWVVFENNDENLWARVSDSIRLFLRTQWRLGALFGSTEDEAFFITCDRTTMSEDDILNGRLICEIGIAPVRPAEFVIFRIFQHTADTQN